MFSLGLSFMCCEDMEDVQQTNMALWAHRL